MEAALEDTPAKERPPTRYKDDSSGTNGELMSATTVVGALLALNTIGENRSDKDFCSLCWPVARVNDGV